MGYLNKATITVDAILTNRGRELLAQGGVGDTGFKITKFAVSDDEIDYGLYTTGHPNGTPYYGAIIENMPVLEATPDEQQIMRYKLVSLDFNGNPFIASGVTTIPRITGTLTADFTINSATPSPTISIATNPTYTETYTVLVANANLFQIFKAGVLQTNISANGSMTISNIPSGTNQLTFTRIESQAGKSTTVTVTGNDTGATSSVTVTTA